MDLRLISAMRQRFLHVLAIAVVVCLLGGPRLANAQLLSPGKLNSSHGNLGGDDDCSQCHESGKRVSAARCLQCHKDLGARINAGAGLHGRQYKGKPCEDCHIEHLGPQSKLIRWPQGAMDKLDHNQAGYALQDKHAVAKCLDCHTKKSPLGKPQFLGTSPACGSCHKDPHKGKFSTKCETCHTNAADWNRFDEKAFDHNLAAFPLRGKHQSTGCDKCHGKPPKWKGIAFATCESCHKDPHAKRFAPKACEACHNESTWKVDERQMRTDHPKLSLANGHAEVKCERCHDRGKDKAPSKGGKCVSCHKPVHEAKFGNACETCHKPIKWLGLADAVGRDAHKLTPFLLQGKHVQAACDGCHKKQWPVAKRYRQLEFARCNQCHEDSHKGEFVTRQGGECAQCHSVAGFVPTTFGPTEHQTTAFALDGKHIATPCSGCHGNARPRASYKLPERACLDCHENPHGKQFAAEMAKGGCAQCHNTRDWRAPRIDHSIWPLTGAHGKAACARCHGQAKIDGDRAAFRGVPRDCEGCHEDVHAGQFSQTAPRKTCMICHTTEAFKGEPFDHALKTGFALVGKHAPLECAKCHPATTLRNGKPVQRFRLGFRLCKDCHADPHAAATGGQR